MATVKPTLRRKNQLKDGTFTIYFRLSHAGTTNYIPTDFRVKENQFKNGNVVKHPSATHINMQLGALLNDYNKRLIDASDRLAVMSILDVKKMLTSAGGNGLLDFYEFAKTEGVKETLAGRSLETTLEATITYLKRRHSSLYFQDISVPWLKDMEINLRIAPKSKNTISYHMRNIRNLFNRAINADLLDQKYYPFRRYKIPKGKRQEEKDLSVEELRTLMWLEDITDAQKKARDLLMLSFYLIGINFKDLLICKNNQVKHQRLTFDRSKTSRHYSIFIEPEAQVLIDRYKGSDYLLSFLDGPVNPNRKTPRHKDITDNTNRRLKLIKDKIGVDNLSTSSVRYTWATLASNIGISQDVISAALGHNGGSKVTAIYINFDQTKVDKANRKVIDYVFEK